MLTLTEETALLLYTRRRAPGSDAEYDTLSRYGGEVRLLAGAALMDLALLGRVQVRPVSPSGRLLRVILGIIAFLVVVALFLGVPLTDLLSGIHVPIAASPAAAFPLFVVLSFVLVLVVGWAFGNVLRDKLVIVDRTPTSDAILSEVLKRIERVGRQAPIRRYLRSFGLRTLPSMRDAIIAQLEHEGLVTPPIPGPTVFGLLDRRQVRRDRPEFQAIGDSIRRLVLDRTTVDTRAVALLLLFAWSTYYRSVGWQVETGVYQFFTAGERGQLREYLRSLRRGDQAIAAQIGPDLYEALRAIAKGVMQLRQQDSASGG
jgi:hypothetical protein